MKKYYTHEEVKWFLNKVLSEDHDDEDEDEHHYYNDDEGKRKKYPEHMSIGEHINEIRKQRKHHEFWTTAETMALNRKHYRLAEIYRHMGDKHYNVIQAHEKLIDLKTNPHPSSAKHHDDLSYYGGDAMLEHNELRDTRPAIRKEIRELGRNTRRTHRRIMISSQRQISNPKKAKPEIKPKSHFKRPLGDGIRKRRSDYMKGFEL